MILGFDSYNIQASRGWAGYTVACVGVLEGAEGDGQGKSTSGPKHTGQPEALHAKQTLLKFALLPAPVPAITMQYRIGRRKKNLPRPFPLLRAW